MKLQLDFDLVKNAIEFHQSMIEAKGMKLVSDSTSAYIEYKEGDEIDCFSHLLPIGEKHTPLTREVQAEIVAGQEQVDPPAEPEEIMMPGIRDRRLDNPEPDLDIDQV